MPRRSLPMLFLLALGLPFAGLLPARSEEPPAPLPADDDPRLLPVEAIVPGMRGHGFTVRRGTKVERFEVEVVDVFRQWLVRQDLILVRCLGEEFADHRVAQGMSGSPIYFDGRLAGALSYAFSWSHHALGGVTPIKDMLAEGRRPLEGRPTGALPPTPLVDPERAGAAAVPGAGDRIVPIGTPLAVGGLSAAGRGALARALAERTPDARFRLVGAPGAAPPGAAIDAALEPGCAITVDLMRGDFAVSALGTVTAVEGPLVFGFGHTFDVLGETLLPASVGYVYETVATQDISFKLGAPLREIGALVQDRQACIVCDTRKKAPMVPVRIGFRNAVTGQSETFRFEVTPNTAYFQPLMSLGIREAFSKAETTLGPNTKRMKMTVRLAGLPPWTYEDVIAGFDGGFQRTLMGLIDRPLIHPTQRPSFESFDLDVEVEHTDRRAWIRSVVADKDDVRRGERVGLVVELEPVEYGPRIRERLEVVVPHDAPTGNYVMTVLGGDFVSADVPNPVDVADMPGLYDAFLKSTELVVLLPRARVDVGVRGHLLRRPPLSSLPRLLRTPEARDLDVRQVEDRVRRPTAHVIEGRGTVAVRVAP